MKIFTLRILPCWQWIMIQSHRLIVVDSNYKRWETIGRRFLTFISSVSVDRPNNKQIRLRRQR